MKTAPLKVNRTPNVHIRGSVQRAPFLVAAVLACWLCLLGTERFVGSEDAAGYFLEKQTVLVAIGHAGHH